eukprot:scaffold8628_cov116-Skeletonema_marinoi.AAC.1
MCKSRGKGLGWRAEVKHGAYRLRARFLANDSIGRQRRVVFSSFHLMKHPRSRMRVIDLLMFSRP